MGGAGIAASARREHCAYVAATISGVPYRQGGAARSETEFRADYLSTIGSVHGTIVCGASR